jgi:hypothetical protein
MQVEVVDLLGGKGFWLLGCLNESEAWVSVMGKIRERKVQADVLRIRS